MFEEQIKELQGTLEAKRAELAGLTDEKKKVEAAHSEAVNKLRAEEKALLDSQEKKKEAVAEAWGAVSSETPKAIMEKVDRLPSFGLQRMEETVSKCRDSVFALTKKGQEIRDRIDALRKEIEQAEVDLSVYSAANKQRAFSETMVEVLKIYDDLCLATCEMQKHKAWQKRANQLLSKTEVQDIFQHMFGSLLTAGRINSTTGVPLSETLERLALSSNVKNNPFIGNPNLRRPSEYGQRSVNRSENAVYRSNFIE